MKSLGHTGQEPWWTLVWHDDFASLATHHRFAAVASFPGP